MSMTDQQLVLAALRQAGLMNTLPETAFLTCLYRFAGEPALPPWGKVLVDDSTTARLGLLPH
jgi:hypothetical protein